MAKRYTQEEFIARAITKHGEGRYDYSMVKYVKNSDAAFRNYCKKHRYRLIEIPYTELRHIDEILEQELKP